MNAVRDDNDDRFKSYFDYLQSISRSGRLYKRCVTSPILFGCGRLFGPRLVEVGSGVGSGILGAFSSRVVGLEINPYAVDYTRGRSLQSHLIESDGIFPLSDGTFDACVLDNVLEHIENPCPVMEQCLRITRPGGGLVVAVPGGRGYAQDADHKNFYDAEKLRSLDPRWELFASFSMPFVLKSKLLSNLVRQYCLVGVYRKRTRMEIVYSRQDAG